MPRVVIDRWTVPLGLQSAAAASLPSIHWELWPVCCAISLESVLCPPQLDGDGNGKGPPLIALTVTHSNEQRHSAHPSILCWPNYRFPSCCRKRDALEGEAGSTGFIRLVSR